MYVRTKSGKSASTLTVASGTSTRYFPARDISAQAVERPLQAFVELDLGLPAELFTRARGVERDVLDLAGAFGGVFDLEAVGRELVQHLDDVEHRLLLAEPDVDRPVGVGLGGAEVRVHHVGHVHVVARLLAVAEDRAGLALEQLAAEDRDHAGLAERVLSRAVDVPVTKRHRREAVQPVEDLAVLLGAELRQAVGSLGRDRVVLGRRNLLALAVDGP